MKSEMTQADIYAYHHTTLENGRLILINGFDSKYFKKIHLGFGVQCILNHTGKELFGGKQLDGEIEVFFANCKYLDIDNQSDRKIIIETLDKIREAEPYEKQVQIAKSEASRIIAIGYDAYTFKYHNEKGIIFLKYPKPVQWIKYDPKF
jgi:hypothetical protein